MARMMPNCPKCGSTEFRANDVDERTVRISCAKCRWTPPDVKIDHMGDREDLR